MTPTDRKVTPSYTLTDVELPEMRLEVELRPNGTTYLRIIDPLMGASLGIRVNTCELDGAIDAE